MAGKFSPVRNLLTISRDKYLVKGSLAGNSSAFTTLMYLNKRRVEAIARRFFTNQNDIDDFIQNVFLKAYNSLELYRGESLFSTWLTKIAFNVGIDAVKRSKNTEILDEEHTESIVSPYETPEEKGIKEVTRQAVKSAIAELPENYARCVEMHFFLGMTYEDISNATGTPVNTIKTHIFNAKKLLYSKLKEFKV